MPNVLPPNENKVYLALPIDEEELFGQH